MRRTRFLSVFTLVVLLLGTGSVVIAGRPLAVGEPAQASYAAGQTAGWQVYQDADYGFTVEYPAGWKAEITIDLHDPDPKPEWVLRRHIFMGDTGVVFIDVSAANGTDLPAWLKWVGEVTAPFPAVEPNATVAGYPAVAFVQNGVPSVFVSDGRYVYQLLYTAVYSENGLQAYQHMLDTFRLAGSTTVGAEIPQSVIQSARQILESRNTPMQGGCESVYNQGCCGLYHPACNGFPCSRLDGVDKGNCTWYVCYCYGEVPFRGNAGTWWTQVPAHPAWTRGSYPAPFKPNIAWWSNHVAFISSGSNPTVMYEMMWCYTCARQRPFELPGPTGYIWKVN